MAYRQTELKEVKEVKVRPRIIKKRRRACNVSVIQIKIRSEGGTTYKYPVIVGKTDSEPQKYVPVALFRKNLYSIVSSKKKEFTLKDLLDKELCLSNGRRIIKGKVVEIYVSNSGGGTTTPAPAPLPPIDE